MATAQVLAKAADRIPKELPLMEFLRWAADRNREHRHTPPIKGEHRSPLWEFVRCAKAHPDLANLTADEAFEKVQGIPWRAVFPDSDDPEMEFLVTWDKVRVPAGEDILHFAASLAGDRPLRPKRYISPAYGRYLSIAGRLQELRPNDYVNLPVERLAELLRVDKRMVSNYSQQARADGYITLVGKHHKPSGTAAKYIFHCEKFNMETGEELTSEEDPHFHKECKDSKDSEDLKEFHDQVKTGRTWKEHERQEGLSRLMNDSERFSGLPRGPFSSENENQMGCERRKLLQAQVVLIKQRFGPPEGAV